MGEETPLEPGMEVAGRYRIEEMIGRGGFATVYRAIQEPIGRPVAVKVMETRVAGLTGEPSDQERQALETLVERFHREARIIGRLNSPTTVTLHDFGCTPDDDIYMVLEYVDGVSLDEVCGTPLAPDRVVSILSQALKSLGEAHDQGVLHRDIKPANLMLFEQRDQADRLKILDFGIAKVLRTTDEKTLRQLTGESHLVGTPRYVAPELATNHDPGPPVDIYSLGLVAYELLLGSKAVPGDNAIEVLDNHLSDDFQARIPERPAIPEELRRIVNRMLAKDPAQRYSTADAVLEDLEALPGWGQDYAETSSRPQPAATEGVDEPKAEPLPTTQPESTPDPTVDRRPSDAPETTAPANRLATTEPVRHDADASEPPSSDSPEPAKPATSDSTPRTVEVDVSPLVARTDTSDAESARRPNRRSTDSASLSTRLAVAGAALLIAATAAILALFVF